jgi:signal transduction histidine kinase
MSREMTGLGESLHNLARAEVVQIEIGRAAKHFFGICLRLVLLLATVVGPTTLLAGPVATHAYSQSSAVAFNLPLLATYAGMFALFVLPVFVWHWLQQQSARRKSVVPRNSPRFRADMSDSRSVYEEERKHLSRELHDSIGQILTAVGLQLRAIRSKSLSSDQLQLRLDEACRLNGEALRLVRDLARGLRMTLPGTGLAAALESQARQLFDVSGVRISLQISEDLDALPEQQRMCIYRCVQEALTNCAKHAHASSVRIAVQSRGDRVNVSVEDDGVGFNHQTSEPGLGLLGMRERIADVNGKLSIDARRQGGTVLRLEIPSTRSTPV